MELRGNTFVGRIFFGDPATGQVAWDCDCRPSDACWLALKVGAGWRAHSRELLLCGRGRLQTHGMHLCCPSVLLPANVTPAPP